MFLGLNGIVVKSHGGTDAFGFANAVGVAVDMARNGFNDDMIEDDFAAHRARRSAIAPSSARRRDGQAGRDMIRRSMIAGCGAYLPSDRAPTTTSPSAVDTSRRVDQAAHRHPAAPYRAPTAR